MATRKKKTTTQPATKDLPRKGESSMVWSDGSTTKTVVWDRDRNITVVTPTETFRTTPAGWRELARQWRKLGFTPA